MLCFKTYLEKVVIKNFFFLYLSTTLNIPKFEQKKQIHREGQKTAILQKFQQYL